MTRLSCSTRTQRKRSLRRAFFRSVWHLGVRGGERRHYWSLLAWTLVRRPRLLPLAVTLAIHGHHFRKVTELQGL